MRLVDEFTTVKTSVLEAFKAAAQGGLGCDAYRHALQRRWKDEREESSAPKSPSYMHIMSSKRILLKCRLKVK